MSKLLILPAAVLALVLTACGDDDGGSSTTSTETGGGGGGMSLSISDPADGATVTEPFTVKFDSSVPLGPTNSGEHHVHLYFDGDDSEYTVVESDSAEVKDLPPGEHVINVSLRNADHSPAGVETKITVTVGEGGSSGEPSSESSSEEGSEYGNTGSEY